MKLLNHQITAIIMHFATKLMEQDYLNRQIQPEQLSTRRIPKVQNLSEAKSQALAQVQQRSGIPPNELVAVESFDDKNLHLTIKHTKSTQTFHFEFECTYSN